jgi:hypothetical protein
MREQRGHLIHIVKEWRRISVPPKPIIPHDIVTKRRWNLIVFERETDAFVLVIIAIAAARPVGDLRLDLRIRLGVGFLIQPFRLRML